MCECAHKCKLPPEQLQPCRKILAGLKRTPPALLRKRSSEYVANDLRPLIHRLTEGKRGDQYKLWGRGVRQVRVGLHSLQSLLPSSPRSGPPSRHVLTRCIGFRLLKMCPLLLPPLREHVSEGMRWKCACLTEILPSGDFWHGWLASFVWHARKCAGMRGDVQGREMFSYFVLRTRPDLTLYV